VKPESSKPEKAGRLAALREALDDGAVRSAQRLIATLHPAEIAQLLESLPPARREIVWELTDPELDGDVLIELSEDVRDELISEMDAQELAAAAENMEVDDLADLIDSLPETVTQQLLHNMDQQDRERLTRMLSWPEDPAGSLRNTDTVSVRADVSLEVVQRYLRMRGELLFGVRLFGAAKLNMRLGFREIPANKILGGKGRDRSCLLKVLDPLEQRCLQVGWNHCRLCGGRSTGVTIAGVGSGTPDRVPGIRCPRIAQPIRQISQPGLQEFIARWGAKAN
jgi:hypothetical protein